MKTIRSFFLTLPLLAALAIPVLADEIDMPSEPVNKTGGTLMFAALLLLLCVAVAIVLIRILKPKK